ncbi:MAG: MbnP family protein [Bdellovibrionota bacterium]
MKKILGLSLLACLSACSDGSSGSSDSPVAAEPVAAPLVTAPVTAPAVEVGSKEVSINFAAKVQGEALACFDKSAAMKAQGQIFTDLRMFISNVALVNDQGQDVKLTLTVDEGNQNLQFVDANGNSIALLNYLDASCAASDATKVLKNAITGLLPYGHYTALKFQLGLPYPAMDSSLTKMPAALAPTDMAWMWEHFPADFQLETSDGVNSKVVNALTSSQKTVITLPLDFTHAAASIAPQVELELSKLFVSTADVFVSGIETTCRNNNLALTEASANCAQVYKAFGLPIQNPSFAYEQSVFSIALGATSL